MRAQLRNLSHRFPHWGLILVLVAALFLYGSSLKFPIDGESANLIAKSSFWSDITYINSLEQVRDNWVVFGHIRPIVTLSFFVDQFIWGTNSAFGFHLSNIVLHLISVGLFYLLVWVLTRNIFVTVVATFIWVIFPWTAFVVGWIAQRNDSLAAIFSFLSLLTFHLALKKRSFLKWGGISALFYGMAVLSKETAMLLPLAIPVLFILLLQQRPPDKKLVLRYILPHVIVLGLYLFLRTVLLVGLIDLEESAAQFAYLSELYGGEFLTIWIRLAFNLPILIFQGFIPYELIVHWWAFISLVSGYTILVILLTIAWKRTNFSTRTSVLRMVLGGWLLFGVMILPLALNPTPRLFYIPSIGIAIAGAYGMVSLKRYLTNQHLFLRAFFILATILVISATVATGQARLHLFSTSCSDYMGALPEVKAECLCNVTCGFTDTVKSTKDKVRSFFVGSLDFLP